MMSVDEAIRRLNLMIERGQDKNNEAIRVACLALQDKREENKRRSEAWKSIRK